MSVRPPSDAAVALRSLPRRFRSLFADVDHDQSADALAQRPAEDGTTALGHLVAAARSVAAAGRGLDQIQLAEGVPLEDVTSSASTATGPVEERLAELGWEVDATADRVERTMASEWGRVGKLSSSGQTVSALDLVWRAVDDAIAHLKAAERALEEARRADR
jgi:hypothetical protein